MGIMPTRKTKSDVITFKADASLAEAIKAVPNRSAFIRNAILAALDNACPLCSGTGVLTTDQMKHWKEFTADHSVAQCGKCREFRLVCGRGDKGRRKRGKSC